MHGLSAVSAIVPVLVMSAVLVFFVYYSYIFFQRVSLFRFLTKTSTLISIKHTLLITAIALLVAIPIGTMAAIYLSEYASPAIRRILKSCLEALADLPTAVCGFLVLIFFGIGDIYITGLVTGVLIAPIVSFLSEKAISKVPKSLRQRDSDMELSKGKVIVNVVLRAACPGIIASFAIAASRALGITMIALHGIPSMTTFIRKNFNRLNYEDVFVVGLVLLLMTVSLTSFGYWLRRCPPHSIRVRPISDTVTDSPSSKSQGNAFFGHLLWDRGFTIIGLLSALLGVVMIGLLLTTYIKLLPDALDTDFYGFLSQFFKSPFIDNVAVNAAVNSACLLVLTVLFSFSLSIGTALYLEEYGPSKRFKQFLGFTIANLATVPSLLYGFVGLVIFAPLLQPLTYGRVILVAALMLTLVVLPILTIELRAALRAVPRVLRQTAYARGMSRRQVISRIILPAAFPGILAALLRSLSRSAGEVVPLSILMNTLRMLFIGSNPFDQPLPLQLFFFPVMLLFIPIIFVNVAAGLLRDRYYHRRSSLLRSR